MKSTTAWVLLRVWLLCGLLIGPLRAQQVAPEVVRWWRPLEKAADLLEQYYAKLVTYEDPVWRWRGDTDMIGRNVKGEEILGLKARSFTMPSALSFTDTSQVTPALVEQVVQAYEHQNPDGPRFRVIQSKAGINIVPITARNEAGSMAGATSLLDAPINVLSSRRTATGHVNALCQAVADATGVKLQFLDNSFNRVYAANGYLIANVSVERSERAKSYMEFEWGASSVTAREALADLLEHSMTTATWRTDCMPELEPKNEVCYLSVNPLVVGSRKQTIRLDRCTSCTYIPDHE